jgi:DNA repair protein RecN (Recombination protein N)
MLTELRVSNFAVIERLGLEFSNGLQVLTGETGAGKSIIVDAIALLIGGRASSDQIRAEADEAVLEAAFSLSVANGLCVRLRDAGLLGLQDTELIIRRVLSRSGRHRVYINGNLASLTLLQSLAGTLVDIHGQHEQQSLLSSHAQLEMLDAFGRLKDLREEYAAQYERWQAHRRALEDAAEAASQRGAREDMLRFQVEEIERAQIQSGEEDSLMAERHRLSHARRLAELGQEAYEALYGGETAVLGTLGLVATRLRELTAIDGSVSDWTSQCQEAEAQLQDLAIQLRDYRERLEADPERLATIEDRLDVLQRLKKKYGGSLEAVLTRGQELKRELEAVTTSESRLAELREALSKEYARLEVLAARLTEERQRAARKLETKVEEELVSLRMQHTRFTIGLESDPGEAGLGPAGRDRVAYLLSANPGEPLQPLARVASGGELSRVMLALKTVLAEADRVPVLIFDEVDAGVGGAVAATMGRRLRDLARLHQVFCITHLPQIASQAGTHFVVEKSVTKGRTVTRVRQLSPEGRREEIARMLAGTTITKAARETAAEMIGEAERRV